MDRHELALICLALALVFVFSFIVAVAAGTVIRRLDELDRRVVDDRFAKTIEEGFRDGD